MGWSSEEKTSPTFQFGAVPSKNLRPVRKTGRPPPTARLIAKPRRSGAAGSTGLIARSTTCVPATALTWNFTLRSSARIGAPLSTLGWSRYRRPVRLDWDHRPARRGTEVAVAGASKRLVPHGAWWFESALSAILPAPVIGSQGRWRSQCAARTQGTLTWTRQDSQFDCVLTRT